MAFQILKKHPIEWYIKTNKWKYCVLIRFVEGIEYNSIERQIDGDNNNADIILMEITRQIELIEIKVLL